LGWCLGEAKISKVICKVVFTQAWMQCICRLWMAMGIWKKIWNRVAKRFDAHAQTCLSRIS